MNNRYKKLLIFSILAVAFLLSGGIALAQNLGVNYASNLGLTGSAGTDPRMFIVNIVRYLLAFLALVAVIVLLYGGFLWMTSAGNPARLEKAKKTVIGAIIGLIIVIAAFAIVTFVVNFTNQSLAPACSPECDPATEKCCSGNYCCSSGTTCCSATNECCPAGQYCCGAGVGCSATPCTSIGGPANFRIEATTPKDGDSNVIRNVNLKFVFNSAIDAATVSYGATFKVEQGATLVAGTATVAGRRISFVPDSVCPANPCGAANCFDPFTGYTVSAYDINSSAGTALTLMYNSSTGLYDNCGSGALPACTVDFTTGDSIDCDNPQVGFDGFTQACIGPAVPIDVWASDGSLVDNVELYVNAVLDATNFNVSADNPFNTTFNWDGSAHGSAHSVGDPFTFTATAYDIDDHSKSVSKTLNLREAHCCDGLLNGGEEGLDCGGGDCAACDGAACGISLSDDCSLFALDCHLGDDKCASGFCECGGDNATCTGKGYEIGVNNCCLCESTPVISWVAPVGNFCEDAPNTYCQSAGDCPSGDCNALTPNGAAGNFVTIGGSSFGTTPGKVEFSNGGGGWVEAPLANDNTDGNPACGPDSEMWTDNMIVVVVPGGIAEGPIRVTHAISSNYDDTNAGNGPLIDDFLINSIVRPGLCDVSPSSAQVDAVLTYQGVRLNGAIAYFGNTTSNIAGLSSAFGAQSGTAILPNLKPGNVTTFARTGVLASNYLPFSILKSAPSGPQIVSVDPGTGPEGQYITITGSGFGGSRGSSVVYFGDEISGTPADIDFPDVCDAAALWSDNQVIIKVPAIVNGSYPLTMNLFGTLPIRTSDFGIPNFNVNSAAPLTPGLCKLSHRVRNPADDISLFGENFGASGDAVRFQLNQNQTVFAYWGDNSGDGMRVDTTVPLAAVTGPVRVVQGGEESNPLNLIVGSCLDAPIPDDACGIEYCCPQGTFYEGNCEADINNCSIAVTSSVYEWEFSTESGTIVGGPGSPCHDPSSLICTNLSYPECDTITYPGIYCNESTCTCQLPGSTYDSCAGQARALGRCLEGNFCPNSPGQCSLYAGGIPVPIGDCSDAVCDGLGVCGPTCTYNSTLNKCVDAGLSCSLNQTAVDVLGNTVAKYCDWYSPGDARWFINTPMSCPLGFTNVGGGRCVENASSCTMCGDGYNCLDPGSGSGVCGINRNICPAGSTCTADECITLDTGECECCCRMTNAAQDCCAPLDCFGDCGNDANQVAMGNPDPNVYGMCTGCADSPDPDGACNCVGSSGKFCDITSGADRDGNGSPDGVCRDCSYLGSNTADCTLTTSCCVDDMNSQNCRGLGGSTEINQAGIDYCAYFECDAVTPTMCDSADLTAGSYYTRDECDTDCPISGAVSPLGSKCENTTFPGFCDTGVPDCGVFGCIDNGAGDDCRCCCDPSATPDQCELMNPEYDGLRCSADKGDCTGANRGLCCGCSEDDNCGSPNDIGCGTDTCCHQRPNVEAVFPADNAPSVCLNGLITANFDQSMDIGSFSGNVILLMDNGTEPCPAGTEFLAAAGWEPIKYGIIRSTYNKLTKAIKNIFSSVSNPPAAMAYTPPSVGTNYCAISGSAGGYNDLLNNGVLQFSPKSVMEGSTLHYMIIVGDKDLDSRTGINNSWGVGLNASQPGPAQSPSGTGAANNTFNGIYYANSYIWSFTTMDDQGPNNGLCEVTDVNLIPASYLFQRLSDDPNEVDSSLADPSFNTVPDSDTLFVIEAKNSSNQVLHPVAPGYFWTWNWEVDDINVADFSAELAADAWYIANGGDAGNLRLVEASGTRTEGRTIVRSTIVMDAGNTFSMAGDGLFDESLVTIFLCENPWPPVKAGLWYPWRDEYEGAACKGGTGTCHDAYYEFFYCRDKGKFGSADDLPAILSDNVVTLGDSGSPSSGVIKESYFFREAVPSATTTLVLTDPESGGTALAEWGQVIGDGYKLYWGTRSNSYNEYANIDNAGGDDHPDVSCTGGAIISCDVSNLTNNKKYYFNITSTYTTGAESAYHGEQSIIVTDTSAPAGAPALSATSSDGAVDFDWTAVTDAASYQLLYRIDAASPYGGSQNVGNITGVIINDPSRLRNGEDYYFIVRAVDVFGNEGPDSNEVTVIPFARPGYLLAEATSTTEIDLSWELDSAGVADVNIYWGTVQGDYTLGSASLGGHGEFYTVGGLTANTRYYFIVQSENSLGEASIKSNEASARTPF